MKIKSSLVVAGIAAIALIYSCAKESLENTFPANNSSNGSLANFIAQNAPPMQQFTVDASTGGIINGISGAVVMISPNSFLFQNNQPVSGNVTISVQEVYSKQAVIFSGASTTANGLPLVSGGEIFISAFQASQELILANANSITVQIPAGNNPQPMQEFTAQDFNSGNDFALVSGPTGQVAVIMDSTAAFGYANYQFQLNSLNWTNCDQYNNPGAEQTQFMVPLSGIFDGHNSMLIVTSPTSMYASKVSFFDYPSNSFQAGYYALTIGDEFTFSIVSEINGQFYWDTRTVTITEHISVALNPQPTTEAQVLQNINSL